MKLSYSVAPAHRFLMCAGVFVLVAVGACENAPRTGDTGDRTLELHGDTIDVAAGVTLHDIEIRSAASSDFLPSRISVKQGDIVRFTTGDTRTHAIALTAPNSDGALLLQASGQLRSPPLVARGQAWVVSLENLPPGDYVASCVSHAGTATLTLR